MPNKSSKTVVKSVRIPVDLWEELNATAAAKGRRTNEEIVARLVAGADEGYRRPEVGGQASIFDVPGV